MANHSYWESVGGRYNDGWEQPAMAAMSAIWVMREASSAFMGRLLTPAPGGGERLREERRPVEHPGTAREGAVSEQAADRVRSSLREA